MSGRKTKRASKSTGSGAFRLFAPAIFLLCVGLLIYIGFNHSTRKTTQTKRTASTQPSYESCLNSFEKNIGTGAKGTEVYKGKSINSRSFVITSDNLWRKIQNELPEHIRDSGLTVISQKKNLTNTHEILQIVVGISKTPGESWYFKKPLDSKRIPLPTLAPTKSIPAKTRTINVPPTELPKDALPTPAEITGQLAIIIDDFGQHVEIAQQFLTLDIPITFAVLPHLPASSEVARLAHAENKTVLLHLPMEPQKYPKIDPGPGKLLQTMSEEQLLQQLREDLELIPHIQGVNNHMGSELTMHKPLMEIVMRELRNHDLFFVDSRTTPQTIAYQTAKEIGVRVAQRDLFLDNINDTKEIIGMIEKAIELAKARKRIVVIGHAYKNTYQALLESIPVIEREGIELVDIQQLLQ